MLLTNLKILQIIIAHKNKIIIRKNYIKNNTIIARLC